MRIFSAATGAGKATYGMGYIVGLIESAEAFKAERGHQPSALIVVEQKTKANVMYKEMVELLGKKRVAVYTNDHDREHEGKSPVELQKDSNRTEQNPAAFFYREELADYPVAIGTANFVRNGGRGDENGMDLATLMRDGRRLDFVLVDEQIDEVETFPVVCADIASP
jgi:hypothetical protein